MTPIIIGGLHCSGWDDPAMARRYAAVVPPIIIGGLHCSGSKRDWMPVFDSVVPSIIGGLHCSQLLRDAASKDHDAVPVIQRSLKSLRDGSAAEFAP